MSEHNPAQADTKAMIDRAFPAIAGIVLLATFAAGRMTKTCDRPYPAPPNPIAVTVAQEPQTDGVLPGYLLPQPPGTWLKYRCVERKHFYSESLAGWEAQVDDECGVARVDFMRGDVRLHLADDNRLIAYVRLRD